MSALYTPEMLALSAELAGFAWSEDFTHRSDARSPVCGSTISIGLNLSERETVSGVGLKVSACAVGQSAAAILARGVEGRSRQDVEDALLALRRWLRGEGMMPDWPGLRAVEGALAHPGRHGALILPWEAASKALSSTE